MTERSPGGTSLWHLAATIEEILDSSIADARSRSKHRRQMVEHMTEMEDRILKRIDSIGLSPKASAQLEGLILSPATLTTWGKAVVRWILPLSIGVYEAVTHALPHLKP